jgi:hypothetical protein
MLWYKKRRKKSVGGETGFNLIDLNGRGGVSLPSLLVRLEIQLALYALPGLDEPLR